MGNPIQDLGISRYRGAEYNCNLNNTCRSQGKEPMDLCNGGMIWSCCVDREKVDYINPTLGAIKDTKRGKKLLSGGQARFVGGHPWSAVIIGTEIKPSLNRTGVLCGGALISEHWVITVAQCFNKLDLTRPMKVRLGDRNVKYRSEKFLHEDYHFEKEEVHVHPDFNRETFKNDIALIRLKEAVVDNKHIRPVRESF